MKRMFALFTPLLLAGCSVFGQTDVETAPYKLITSIADKNIEIREYQSMVLVSTPMNDDSEDSAFRRLFNYISGENKATDKIAMTAPVFMNNSDNGENGKEIAMTAPVLMNKGGEKMMSFVMPSDFTLETTPKPTNPKVQVSEITDYKVAAITFSGTLSESNVRKYSAELTNWLESNGYEITGPAVEAAYNGPFTIPVFRRNEILIPVKLTST